MDDIVPNETLNIRFNVYTWNWNESRLLPTFLHHYRQANRIIVYDNETSDNLIELIKMLIEKLSYLI